MKENCVNVRQARALLQEDPDAVYLDVRTEAEFADGHPEKAINIPIAMPNPARGMLEPNPDFVEVARLLLPLDTPLLVGCRTGPRAETAARLLSEAGFRNVTWVLGGYVGITDPRGATVAPGWVEMGFPTSQDTGDGVSYASLKRRAGL
jgi:rhodanese-related sulfurtransferase